jgi:CHAT domain-containing protein
VVLAAAEELARRGRLPGITSDAGYEHGLLLMARGRWDSAATRFATIRAQVEGFAWGSWLDADIRRAEALVRARRCDAAEAALEQGLLLLASRRFHAEYQNREADSVIGPITRFQASLEGGSPTKVLAAQLGRQLVEPAVSRLDASITRLIIVPDGPFYRLPFDALILSDGRHVLLPQASGLPRLPGSGREARDIARRAAAPDLRLRAGASEAALKTALLDEAGLLHLATHASVSDLGILTSGLSLAAGADEDGHLGAGEIATLRLNQALVVLSGCRTVGGAVLNGEGLQGLTTPFLDAGARAIVSTQWAVGDHAMAELMRSFYEAMAKGAPVGEALRETKLRALRRGASPTVWASLALVGDPRPRPSVF